MYAAGKAVFNSAGARKNNDWIYVFNIEVCVITCLQYTTSMWVYGLFLIDVIVASIMMLS